LSRILLFAEAVTLAHVARPIALAKVLRRLGHDVCIAAASAADRWLDAEGLPRQRIASIESSRFLRALARGMPAYDTATLIRYVEDDLAAIAAWPPDIVVGDFRLSLYISARYAQKAYGAIANAYWSRRYWTGVEAPPIAPLSWLPRRLSDALFGAIYPAAFAVHAVPFHRACKRFGVAPPGHDIRDVYTASHLTAFADVEAFYERGPRRADTPPFLGPLAWEPPDLRPLPAFSEGAPIAFISLGSSGQPRVLAAVLRIVGRLPVRCIVATAGSTVALPSNCIHSSDWLPYSAACRAASVVVCNGGAPAVYAALAAACPVVGMPGNLDQLLNLRHLARHGVVTALTSDRWPRKLENAISFALRVRRPCVAAEVASRAISGTNDAAIRAWIERLAKA
jgi:UDP:flavonoid glycosyltransferase YjiC (YdhE family)